jgi:hypothetical protein
LEFEAILPKGSKRDTLLIEYAKLRNLFGVGASDKAASEIMKLL